MPGESYGGSLGVAVISAFTLITGSPFVGIKLTALLFFVLFAICLFCLARRVFSELIALPAVALVCLSPPFLTIMGIRERGAHGETPFFGTLLMYVTIRLYERWNTSAGGWLGFGTLVGFNWYNDYLSIVFIVPCVLFLILNRGLASIRPATALGGVIIGSLPYWLFVLTHRVLPPFDGRGLQFFDPFAGFKNFFAVGFPIVTGARQNFQRQDLVPIFSNLVIFLYLGAIILFLAHVLSEKGSLRSVKTLLALHLVFYPFVFAFSRFAWFADEPRYLIGLYASLPIALAWFLCHLWRHSKILATTAMAIVIGVSVYGSLTVPPDVFNTIFAEPNAAVIRFLREKHLKHFYANYWIAYRIMFETEEELIGATYFGVRYERYPEFKPRVDADPNPAYIAWESEAVGFEQRLQTSGRSYEKRPIGRYIVFYDVHPRLPAD
ncbi:MAG: glycosyltransferase family 39 protein [Acidobacteria bacterium]|nr:glycosyltransferase family 39 protein [Acidobacteriota bacterium]